MPPLKISAVMRKQTCHSSLPPPGWAGVGVGGGLGGGGLGGPWGGGVDERGDIIAAGGRERLPLKGNGNQCIQTT